MNFVTAFDIFELDQDFYSDELKRSYRKKVKAFHPDTSLQATTQDFQLFQKAYEILRTPHLREKLANQMLFPARLVFLTQQIFEEQQSSFETWG